MKCRNLALLIAILAIIASTFTGCSRGPKPGDQSTPTLAYKALFEAVKKKDPVAIKKTLSKGTLEMMEGYASMQKKTLDQVVENGLTETTFASKLPETRNEKIWADVAILEVQNEKTKAWEKLPFQREDGNWKLAIDTFFKGTMSPNGPTNLENPGQLPPGTQAGPPQARPPGKPSLSEQEAAPGKPGASAPGVPGAITPDGAAAPPPKGAKPGSSPKTKKDIKPPTE